jgi:hypothetical protein
MFEGFPVPETVSVRDVRVTVLLLGFVSTTCCTGTLVAPESWFEFPGGLGPCEAETVTAVGVEEGVKVGVAVFTSVFVGLAEGVNVGLRVALEVEVRVGVWVAVPVGVPVLIRVFVAVELAV